MPRFSRRTILAATDLLADASHAELNRFELEHGLENRIDGGSRRDRATSIARLLIRNPEEVNEDGENLSDAVVSAVIDRELAQRRGWNGQFDYESFNQYRPDLNRALQRDGFTVEDGTL